jgi:nitrate reductase NapD
MSDYNVCGVLVMARPDSADKVSATLNDMHGVEVHANNHGKLVVTVEGPNDRDFANRIQNFSNIPGVLSMSLVYHEIEMNDEAPVQPVVATAGLTQELRP